jgi:hypothetical protein
VADGCREERAGLLALAQARITLTQLVVGRQLLAFDLAEVLGDTLVFNIHAHLLIPLFLGAPVQTCSCTSPVNVKVFGHTQAFDCEAFSSIPLHSSVGTSPRCDADDFHTVLLFTLVTACCLIQRNAFGRAFIEASTAVPLFASESSARFDTFSSFDNPVGLVLREIHLIWRDPLGFVAAVQKTLVYESKILHSGFEANWIVLVAAAAILLFIFEIWNESSPRQSTFGSQVRVFLGKIFEDIPRV